MSLRSYDIIKGTAIDYMHGLCLGVMKTLLSLWFTPENSTTPFSIYEQVSKADKRRLQIHPPLEIGRTPRSIEHHRKYWKASELKAFLLYYGIPVLSSILDATYFQHFAFLSQAAFILLQDSISELQLQNCERLLDYFCFMFPFLYDLRYQTINVHNLLHLTTSSKGVRTPLDSFLFSFWRQKSLHPKNDTWDTKCFFSNSHSCLIRSKFTSNGRFS